MCMWVCVGGCIKSQIGFDKGNNVLSVVMSILSHTKTRAGVTRASVFNQCGGSSCPLLCESQSLVFSS